MAEVRKSYRNGVKLDVQQEHRCKRTCPARLESRSFTLLAIAGLLPQNVNVFILLSSNYVDEIRSLHSVDASNCAS